MELSRERFDLFFCPITTKLLGEGILRVFIPKDDITQLREKSEILVDQIRSIDKKRLIKKIGDLPKSLQKKILENLRILVLE